MNAGAFWRNPSFATALYLGAAGPLPTVCLFPPDPHEPRFVTWLRNPRVRRTVILSLLWIFVAAALARFRFALLPFGLAVLVAFIIEPPVAWMAQRKLAGRPIPRIVAILGIYALATSFLIALGSWATSQITVELAGLGQVARDAGNELKALTQTAGDKLAKIAQDNGLPLDRAELDEVWGNQADLTESIKSHFASVLRFGRDLVGGAFRAVFGVFLVLMLTAFMSMDIERIRRFFVTLVPPEYQNAYATISAGVATGLAGVVRGQVMICVTNGLLTFLGLWLLDVKLPLILATIATVFSLIPIFGSILSTIPIVAMGLTDGLAKGFFALLWIVGIHLVEANLLNPKIMGDAAKIHPVIVVFVLVVGEQTAGLIGALFAVPIASVVLTVFKFLHRRALDAGNTQELPELSATAPKGATLLP